MALTKPTRRGRHDHPVPHKQDGPIPDEHEAQGAGKPEEPQELPDEVLQLFMQLNDAGYRAEIRLGQVVVTPPATMQHGDVLDRLTELLYPLKLANRWRFHYHWGCTFHRYSTIDCPT